MTYVATCLFIVLYFLRPFEIWEGLRGVPVLSGLGIGACILLLVDMLSGKVRPLRNGSDAMMLGFCLAIALSHLSHGYVGGASKSLQDFFPAVVGYFLVAHSVNSEKRFKGLVILMIVCTTLIAVEGIFEHRNGISFSGVQPLMQKTGVDEGGAPVSISRIKWVGPFSDPNDLSMLFVCVVPFLLDSFFKKVRLLPLCSFGLILSGLIFTNSRGGFLSLLAAIVAYLTLRYKSMKGVWLGLCSIGSLLVLGPSRMGSMSASEDSAYGRLEAWYSGYQMFKSSPLMGVGKGMFTDYNDLTAHNSFVLVFAELGLLGTLFFVGIFYFPVRCGYNAIFNAPPAGEGAVSAADCTAVLSGLTGVFVSMFFLSRSYVLLPYLFVALAVASCTSYGARDVYEGLGGTAGHYARIFWISTTGIFLVNVLIKILL